MVMFKYFFFAALQGVVALTIFRVHAQDYSAFISIDCGLSDFPNYEDETTGINYIADTNFIETGENKDIAPGYRAQTTEQLLWNVRSFPEGTRNCYTLKPKHGKYVKYLVRARFMYGNYDNKGSLPISFDLYLGINKWDTVTLDDELTTVNLEIIHLLLSDYMYVCLVDIGSGTPFISALELRTLNNETYISEFGSLQLVSRYDYGSATNETMRYKGDFFDRLWSPYSSSSNLKVLNASPTDFITQNIYGPPSVVMSTALTSSKNGSDDDSNLQIYWTPKNLTSQFYIYLFFAEPTKLQNKDFREFVVYINGLGGKPFSPRYLASNTIYTTKGVDAGTNGMIQVWINKTENSTLPPIINALEIYMVKELSGQETNQTDVEAMINIKSVYEVKSNWQGDPCSPEAYSWEGLNCSYDANNLPRIISLNLSSSGLTGEISPYIADLTMIKYLDLSNNSLNGTVPKILAQLSFLSVLNLKGNNLTGSIPDDIYQKWKSGHLSLSVDPNMIPSCSSGSCVPPIKKKNFVVPVAASVGGLFVLLTIALVYWSLKRRKQQNSTDTKVGTINTKSNTDESRSSFVSRKQQFTYSEIQTISNNFERVLGEGGFGKVYHGYLNGNEVAVKMLSPSSVQGHRQFHAELKLLMRVHHKNLTTLVGYCNEGINVGLMYEYMAMGNLRAHLSGRSPKLLSWEDRLRIAIDTAQGLEYLHDGCKPPIVHRDVKSTNILLNEKFQAKLSDFGLSKIFPTEGGTHISASVAGTPGYLDPEYYQLHWLNEKSDVYSFGIVLLEIITGQLVVVKTKENSHIIQWVSSMLTKGDIKSILDPRLQGGFDINTVWRTIEIAMGCVSRASIYRPTMSRVVIELKECLTTEITEKHHYSNDQADPSDPSKDSIEMIHRHTITDIAPLAR